MSSGQFSLFKKHSGFLRWTTRLDLYRSTLLKDCPIICIYLIHEDIVA